MGIGPTEGCAEVPVGPTERGPPWEGRPVPAPAPGKGEAVAEATADDVGIRGRLDGDGVVDIAEGCGV